MGSAGGWKQHTWKRSCFMPTIGSASRCVREPRVPDFLTGLVYPRYIDGKMMGAIGCSFVVASPIPTRKRTTSFLPRKGPPCQRWLRPLAHAGTLKRILKMLKTSDWITMRWCDVKVVQVIVH